MKTVIFLASVLFAAALAGVPAPPLVSPADAVQSLSCRGDKQTLCLLKKRFEVSVFWDNGSVSGPGGVVKAPKKYKDTAGLFFFDNPSRLEMLIQVLNQCSFNNRFWVFYAATTNVEFTITVTDTKSSLLKTYSNPLGTPAPPVQDTAAFATCP